MLLWFCAQLIALAVGAIAFAVLLAVVAGLGGWQNATNRRHHADRHNLADRIATASLAAMLSLAGLVDLRLAGVVITGAVIGSVLVAWQVTRALNQAWFVPALSRAGELVLAWLIVGVPACAATALAQESVSGAVVLVCVVLAYDTGVRIWGSANVDLLSVFGNVLRSVWRRIAKLFRWTQQARQKHSRQKQPHQESARQGLRQLAGIFAGLTGAAATVFAVTAVSIPPYTPDDALRLMLLAIATLPLGQALAARYKRTVAVAEPPTGLLAQLTSTWSLYRLGSLIAIGPVWLWALDVIRF